MASASRSAKRNANETTSGKPPPTKKRGRLFDARKILTEVHDPALNKHGELDVAAFVKAREFEVQALRKSMDACKNVLSSRAFQEVPRHMRRRTASHNVKKVPKRLRSRAAREIKDDNTPTGKDRKKKLTPQQRLRLTKSKGLRRQRDNRRREATMDANRKTIEEVQQDSDGQPKTTLQVGESLKGQLSFPGPKPAKFRRRQIDKTWLPTHLWHAKRARMTEPKHPLWRFAIPVTPTEKCYRTTHRAASSRGCLAWDTSYVSTIGIRGTEWSIKNLLRTIGTPASILEADEGYHWRRGSRKWSGWMRESRQHKNHIAMIDLLWQAIPIENPGEMIGEDDVAAGKESKERERRLWLRIHPSAFHQAWSELVHIRKMQKCSLAFEDLRFQIGSIEVTGPASTEALIASLRPSAEVGYGPCPLGEKESWNDVDGTSEALLENFMKTLGMTGLGKDMASDEEDFQDRASDATMREGDDSQGIVNVTAGCCAAPGKPKKTNASRSHHQSPVNWDDLQSPEMIWQHLTPLSNPALLPAHALLAFNISDPRLRSPFRPIRPPGTDDNFLKLLARWPPDHVCRPADIFEPEMLRQAAHKLVSQKCINRRRSSGCPGEWPRTLPDDPEIPIFLTTTPANPVAPREQGSWTVMLPWDYVLPVWHGLMHYSLSTGGTPRFGGLDQMQQCCFGKGHLWFPGDFPGTSAGWQWELTEREKLYTAWARRPRGRRTEYESIDLCAKNQQSNDSRPKGELGHGWACDWEFLIFGRDQWPRNDACTKNDDALRQSKADASIQTQQIDAEKDQHDMESSSSEPSKPPPFFHIRATQISQILRDHNLDHLAAGLTPVHLRIISKGHPQRCARIYRLPTTNDEWREQWKALARYRHDLRQGKKDSRPASLFASDANGIEGNVLKENNIDDFTNPSSSRYPPIPLEVDLIGFVTSTNYNLGHGECRAIGNVYTMKALELDIDSGPDSGPQSDSISDSRVKHKNGNRHGDKVLHSESVHVSNMKKDLKSGSSLKSKSKSKLNMNTNMNMNMQHLCIVRNAGETVGRLAKWQWAD